MRCTTECDYVTSMISPQFAGFTGSKTINFLSSVLHYTRPIDAVRAGICRVWSRLVNEDMNNLVKVSITVQIRTIATYYISGQISPTARATYCINAVKMRAVNVVGASQSATRCKRQDERFQRLVLLTLVRESWKDLTPLYSQGNTCSYRRKK